MVTVTVTGPQGALLGLANVEAELHGVSCRRTGSGRESSNEVGHGETSMLLCYVDGKRSTRAKALARLSLHVAEGERVVLCGPLRLRG